MMTPIIPIFLFFDSYYSYFSILCTLYTPYIYTHMLLSRFCTLLCALVTVHTAYTIYFFLIHHCTNSLSSLHIFVHHCTLKHAQAFLVFEEIYLPVWHFLRLRTKLLLA